MDNNPYLSDNYSNYYTTVLTKPNQTKTKPNQTKTKRNFLSLSYKKNSYSLPTHDTRLSYWF